MASFPRSPAGTIASLSSLLLLSAFLFSKVDMQERLALWLLVSSVGAVQVLAQRRGGRDPMPLFLLYLSNAVWFGLLFGHWEPGLTYALVLVLLSYRFDHLPAGLARLLDERPLGKALKRIP